MLKKNTDIVNLCSGSAQLCLSPGKETLNEVRQHELVTERGSSHLGT